MVFSQMTVAFDAFQGNACARDYIIKCLAVVDLTKNLAQQFDFAPPFDWNLLTAKSRRQNNFLTNKVHGLAWYDGDIPHACLTKVLKEKTDGVNMIYAKGDENTKFLQNLLGRPVYNLETLLTHMPKDKVSEISTKTGVITQRCAANHDHFDWTVSATSRANGCCFTRALRMAVVVREYNRMISTNQKLTINPQPASTSAARMPAGSEVYEEDDDEDEGDKNRVLDLLR